MNTSAGPTNGRRRSTVRWLPAVAGLFIFGWGVFLFLKDPIGNWLNGPAQITFGLAQQVTFEDLELDQSVRRALGKSDGPITAQDLEKIESLVTSKALSFDGLEYCKNLRFLEIHALMHRHPGPHQLGQIDDLAPVATLEQLGELRFRHAILSDTSPLGQCASLRSITFENVRIDSLKSIAQLQQLSELDLSLSSVREATGLEPIGQFANLKTLIMVQTRFADVGPVAKLTELRFLDLRHSQISDVRPLGALTNLELLWLGDNKISEIAPLVNLDGLKQLDLYGNPLNDAAHESVIPALREKGVRVRVESESFR